jgi:pentatricopeptide repeat protein
MEDAGYGVNRHSAHQLIKALAASGQHDRIMDVHRQLMSEGWKVRCLTPLSEGKNPGRPIRLRC